MLEAHAAPDTHDLYTISANGFSATADAFARDPDSEGLWFLSMVGAQSALKAIWAALLKRPPETAHLLAGTDGMVLSGGFHRCEVPYETLGTWTTKIARLPVSGGWHALVYTRLAEYAFERDAFLLLAPGEEHAPALHHRFLDRRSPLPCIAPGRSGCGGGGWQRARFLPSSRRASTPTAAGPTPRRCARTSPWPSRRGP